ncbi:MAG: hypothetical protein EOP02_17280 [Proteobacteria bacterium]|nr:MAG: hypothetical protein EOP02_17280 [Pseudomonadota bacterium]
MNVKPPVVPVDGTTFHGSVRIMPNGECRAACYVRKSDGTKQEVQAYAFETERDAREWVEATGGARGYTSMTWDA